jgi:UDP:flavonoid glycosyltransferase YjiC (YdhE family)
MEILRLIADRLGRRILLLSGWLPDLHFESHPNICRADFVPLRWMLPRVAAYVHHAGAGTMAEVLRAGTPSVAVPSSGEQHFWAFRMHQMGVIPDPISRKHLTGSALSGSIAETLDHPKMNARRASVSEALKKEDGDNRAADLIEEWLAECCSNNSLRHGR